jgi:two-component system NtrC family response regulator
MAKGKLLVIDDEERLRKLLARILQLEDFEVLEAATAKACAAWSMRWLM